MAILGGHSGSPQLALKVIPRAAMATMRCRFRLSHSSMGSRLKGGSFSSLPISLSKQIFRPPLGGHVACLHSTSHCSLASERMGSLADHHVGIGSFCSQSIGLKGHSFGRLLSSSFMLVRSFGFAEVSSLDEVKEDGKEGKGLGTVDCVEVSSPVESTETGLWKEGSDMTGGELESLRVELRARKMENERLRKLYEQVCDELKAMKLDKPDNGDSPSRSSLLSSNVQDGQMYRSQEVKEVHDEEDSGSVLGLENEITDSSISETGEDHPWPEWSNFLSHLKEKGYFSATVDLEDDEDVDGNGRIKKAVLDFGRDRDDIFESFSKNDLKVLARYGCPSTDKKVVNAGKRLRAYFGISEASACKPCTLKSTCTRAFAEIEVGTTGTSDVIRLLLQLALDVEDPISGKPSIPAEVELAVSSLLKLAVEVSKAPHDPNREPREPLTFSTVAKTRSVEPRSNSRAMNEEIEMKPGDWRCQDCHYVNFSRNRQCRECSASRPPQDMRPGDWECPRCQYVNYMKNLECRECHAERPHGSSIQGARGGRSLEGKQGSRERAFGNKQRDNGRDFGEVPAASTNIRRRHEEWKVDSSKIKRRSDDDLDNAMSDNDQSVDSEDVDSELDDLELDEDDLDEDFDDLNDSDEEILHSKSQKKNSHSSHEDVSDISDFDEEIEDGKRQKKKNPRSSLRDVYDAEDDGDGHGSGDELDDRPSLSRGRYNSRGGRSTNFEYSRSPRNTNDRSSSRFPSRNEDSDYPSRGGYDRGGRGEYRGRGSRGGFQSGRGRRGGSEGGFQSGRGRRGGFEGGYQSGRGRSGGFEGGYQSGRDRSEGFESGFQSSRGRGGGSGGRGRDGRGRGRGRR